MKRPRTATCAISICALAISGPSASAFSDSWPDTVVHYVAQTQVALEECPNLKAGSVRSEMPKSTGLSVEEFDRRVAAALPAVRKKLMEDTGLPLLPGALLCKVALTIYGPDGHVPGFIEER